MNFTRGIVLACALVFGLSGCATGMWPFSGGVPVRTFVPGGRGFADGSASQARFSLPGALSVDSAGNLYVCDIGNSAIRKITPAGEVSTLAGDGEGYAEGSGPNARFNRPLGLAVGPNGVVYVADSGNHRIRAVAPDGTVSTVVGSVAGDADGAAQAARLRSPNAVAVASDGSLYIADNGNRLIRVLGTDGVVRTVAGGSETAEPYQDGQGSGAAFQELKSLAMAPDGNLWVLDGEKLRRLDPAGNVQTVATLSAGMRIYGSNGMSGSSYMTALAIACDTDGSVYAVLMDRIQKVDREGKVSFVAGFNDSVMTDSDGNQGDADGAGGNARFRGASGAAVDGGGNLYVSEQGAGRIRKLAIRP